MPWCPRCGTSLSEHEMSGSYKDVEHLSIFSKLPLKGTNDKMILWTTTPWTLSANVALAVNPTIDYVRVKVKSDSATLILGKNALAKLKGDVIEVVETFKGSELLGKEYETCYPDFASQNFAHKVVAWSDVDATEGTGIVHIAPGCGAEDFELGKTLGLNAICPIDDEGIMLEGFGDLSGLKTTDVVEKVVNHLQSQNKLYKTEMYSHSYPHCWRCKTPVVFKLVDEWNIKTEEIRPKLIEAAKTVKWEPEFAGKRMLDWLNNMGDWTISRKRFYGLPLPFYPCKKCGKLTVIGSREELIKLSENGNIDNVPHLHRPFIDEIKIRCPHCGELVSRIPEVGDCWLDAGITPFSTKQYFSDREYFNYNFPSELVMEMKEQIRLWFYSLLFMSVTLEGKAPYENVVAHSSVVNEEGNKFSKTGFMIRFDEAAEKIGADPVRYLYASANPVNDVRFGYNLTDESRRKMLGFWNIYIFFNLYASIDSPDIANFKPNVGKFTLSDKWLIAKTNEFILSATQNMNAYKPYTMIKDFEALVDDVSNWYIRINRKRFWKTVDKDDQMNAYWCLYQNIKTILGIMAPIIPFLTDYIWQNLVRGIEKDAPISVHLSTYPTPINIVLDNSVIEETKVARDVINIAQRMRNEAQLKIKQPLQTLYLTVSDSVKRSLGNVLNIIKDELNIKDIVFTADESIYNDIYYTVNFRVAGAKLKGEAQKLKQIVDSLDSVGQNNLDKMIKNGSVTLNQFGNLEIALFDGHSRPKQNFVVSKENDKTLALDTTLNEELMAEGIVRELIRQIQVIRKEADFAVEQRIMAEIITDDEKTMSAINQYKDRIMQDILAKSLDKIERPFIERDVEIREISIKIKLAGL